MKKVGDSTNKVFNFRPVFFAAVALCFGILFSYFYKFYDVSAWWLCILLPFVGASFCFYRTKRQFLCAFAAWGALAFFFVCGFAGFTVQMHHFENAPTFDGECYVVGTVKEKWEGKYNAWFILEDVNVNGEASKFKVNAYLPLSFYENVEICDEILLVGNMQTKTNVFEDGFNAYSVDEKLAYAIYAKECLVTGENIDVFSYLRLRLQNRIYAGMDEDAASVMVAVLTGETAGIDEGLLDNMRRGGIAHIFAVSGLHVGALYGFCLLLLQRTKLKKLSKIGRFCLLAVLLLLYGGICGFSPSIVRAITLCLVSYAAKLFLSNVDFLEMLGFSAILILFLSPVDLFNVGFLLSFAACLGIALLQKRIGQVCVEGGNILQKCFPRKLSAEQQKMIEQGDSLPPTMTERFLRFILSVFSVSLAAQLGTAPIQLICFGYLSGWSILLNVVFVPLISAIFSLLLALAVLACLLPAAVSSVVLYLPNLFWAFALLLFEVVDFSSFSLTGMLPMQACICYYLGLIFMTDKLNLSAVFKRVSAWVCLLAAIFLFLTGNL